MVPFGFNTLHSDCWQNVLQKIQKIYKACFICRYLGDVCNHRDQKRQIRYARINVMEEKDVERRSIIGTRSPAGMDSKTDYRQRVYYNDESQNVGLVNRLVTISTCKYLQKQTHFMIKLDFYDAFFLGGGRTY